ncbi:MULTISPECIES: hypothetical protein [unclassified Methylobacterium]|uniref:hypothetical protein n=1 Tax=unclassified Methylobacterium TaxID=2615210 RepID=UPI00226A57FC|nr:MULTISPECIES: hypothetical protein [unclassified Methylobacterium]
MKTVAVLGRKGGSAKTVTAHTICLGAHLMAAPAAYVLTDPEREVRSAGRPYAVLDGRLPEQLELIFTSSQQNLNGWLVIDGGGNRPAWDIEIGKLANLTLVPFRPSMDDIDMATKTMNDIPNAVAWPCAWPTNPLAIAAARPFIERMQKAFPLRVIEPALPFVNSVYELVAEDLGSPSTVVRQTARKAFATVGDAYDEHAKTHDELAALYNAA